MHRLPSKKAIFNFRMAALLLWVRIFMILGSFATLIAAALQKSHQLVLTAIMMFVLTAIIAIIQHVCASLTRCPLCITPVLAGKHCSKNKKAKTFLGSYRLRAANSILLRNHFRCPYCSEPTTLEVRTRAPHQLAARD